MQTTTISTMEAVEGGKRLYMLSWGTYEHSSCGPFLGNDGIDFTALANTFREDRYAQAEAAKEDHCHLDEDSFTNWMLDKGLLAVVDTQNVQITIEHPFEHAYQPKHWPECPSCGEGRGEKEYGDCRQSLNRIATFRRCTSCRHEWGHTEEPNYAHLPMLEDDGRDTLGACVPFAISKACGLDFASVMKMCQKHGWAGTGMPQANAIVAARELGFSLTWTHCAGIGTAAGPTIKRLLPLLDPHRNYIVGVKGHWLSIVNGTVVDNDANTGLGCRVIELYKVGVAS